MKRLLLFLNLLFITSFSFSQNISRRFYADQLSTDIGVLQKALTTLHPGLYRYNSKAQMAASFAALRNKAKNGMQEKHFYLEVAKLTAKIKCGHTYLNPLNMEENIPAQYMPQLVLPFCFVTLDNSFVITQNLTNNPSFDRGTAITAVNGIPVKQIIDSLLLVSRSDGRNGSAKQISNMNVVPERVHRYSVTDIFMPLFFPMNEDLVLTVDRDGIQRQEKIKGVSLAQRAALYKNIFGAVPRVDRLLNASVLQDSILLLKVPTFAFFGPADVYNKFIDSVFEAAANQSSIKHLILDLRLNEGGSGSCRDRLLSYILPRNFEAEAYKERRFYAYKKVPEDLLPFLGYIDSAGLKTKSDEQYVQNEFGFWENKQRETGNFADFPVHKNRFKGNVFLLTSPVNSSAGFEFAWIFQQYKAGTIVGQKTGGTKQGINGGNYFWLRLPYSRIEVDLPFIYQAHIGEADEGITPDHIVQPLRRDIQNGIDTQVEYVLNLIRGKGVK